MEFVFWKRYNPVVSNLCYLIMANILKRMLKLFKFLCLLPPKDMKKYDLILTLYTFFMDFALNIVPCFIKLFY